MAPIPWTRHCSCALAALYLASVVVPQALGQETGPSNIRGALLCADQDAADEVMRALTDPDSEIVVRRLVMLMSEGCKEDLGSQPYDVAKVEPSGILEIHRRRTAAYIVPLAPTDHRSE